MAHIALLISRNHASDVASVELINARILAYLPAVLWCICDTCGALPCSKARLPTRGSCYTFLGCMYCRNLNVSLKDQKAIIRTHMF